MLYSQFETGTTFMGKEGMISVESLTRGEDTTPISQLTSTPGLNMNASTKTERTSSGIVVLMISTPSVTNDGLTYFHFGKFESTDQGEQTVAIDLKGYSGQNGR